MGQIALVTGGNQGLGRALVAGLCRQLGADDTVYLTARDEQRGSSAVAELSQLPLAPTFWRLDVRDGESVEGAAQMLRERHGGVDIVISNAAARISKEIPAREQVRTFVDTNNHGTRRMLGSMLPILRANGRFIVVASSFGTLRNLPTALHRRFDVDKASLDEIETAMDDYVTAVEAGEAKSQGWPEWINIPSKVAQVASAKIAAREITKHRPMDGILVNAVCPGLVNTDASRPWFDDMSSAQEPEQAAEHVLWLALLPEGSTEPHGELIQFRRALPWQ